MHGDIASVFILLATSGRGEGKDGLLWKNKWRNWRKAKRKRKASLFFSLDVMPRSLWILDQGRIWAGFLSVKSEHSQEGKGFWSSGLNVLEKSVPVTVRLLLTYSPWAGLPALELKWIPDRQAFTRTLSVGIKEKWCTRRSASLWPVLACSLGRSHLLGFGSPHWAIPQYTAHVI